MKHFVDISDHSTAELRHMLDVSKRLKAQLKSTGRNDALLAGKTLAMIFEKPSLRTRVSFESGDRAQLQSSTADPTFSNRNFSHHIRPADVQRS